MALRSAAFAVSVAPGKTVIFASSLMSGGAVAAGMQQAASKPVRDPDVQVSATGDGARVVHLSGAWDIRAIESRVSALRAALQAAGPVNAARWDLSQIQRFDHIGAMLVWRAWGRC